MANEQNLKPIWYLSHEEAQRRGRNGGKKSGEVRRKKANFRRALNALLTAEIDSPEWTPLLESLGLESTLESAINAAMIREALNGNVKAYEAIARYSGQTEKTDEDIEEQKAKTEQVKAQTERLRREMSPEDYDIADDGFLDALNGTAAGDWADETDQPNI